MTNAQMIQNDNSTKNNCLYTAIELSNKDWKLIFTNGRKRRQKSIGARNLSGYRKEIDRALNHFKMEKDVKIFSCYEAGRDGFWIHRALTDIGIDNIVMDSSSIEVNRRSRRAKTDRLDVNKLVNMLVRFRGGEKKVWSVVQVPTVLQEDARRIDREAQRLQKERTQHTNRIKSLLVLHGIKMNMTRSFLKDLDSLRLWDGNPLPPHIRNEIVREYTRYKLIQEQLKEVQAEKKKMLEVDTKHSRQVQTLQQLKGIGPVSSWRLIYEFFGWRKFRNVKEVGAASGLAPTPYDSGGSKREQGIAKSGNSRVRSLMVEISWSWLRFQPQSKLSRWFMERFGGGGKRMRRVGIVALARKLLVAFWKYLEKGLVPDGAAIKNLV